MDEDRIERRVERLMDRLDVRLLGGRLSQAEYDAEVRGLAEWVEGEYARVGRQ